MKLLTSAWGVAFIGGVVHLATTAVLMLGALAELRPPSPEQPEKTSLPPRLWSFKTEAVDELISELKAAREKVAEDEKNVVRLRAQTAADQAEIEKVRGEVQKMREEIEARVLEIQESELKNLKTLAQTYAAMNPPQVVAVFREMDENMAVKILAMMKAASVGPILGEMAKAPDRPGEEPMARRAARISDKLRLLKPLKKENT